MTLLHSNRSDLPPKTTNRYACHKSVQRDFCKNTKPYIHEYIYIYVCIYIYILIGKFTDSNDFYSLEFL